MAQRKLDVSEVEAALKRAARAGVSGSREERAGRFAAAPEPAMNDDGWKLDDNWHDESSLERARPDVVKLAESIVSLCRRIDWEKLDGSSRPSAMQAAIVEDIARLIERVRNEDKEAIDAAIRTIPDPAETDRKRRWAERCFQIVVADAVALSRELVRSDNAHRARLSSREDDLRRSILQAADAWK